MAGRLDLHSGEVIALVRHFLRVEEVRLRPQRRRGIDVHEEVERRHRVANRFLIDAVGAKHGRAAEEQLDSSGNADSELEAVLEKVDVAGVAIEIRDGGTRPDFPWLEG